MTNVIVLEKWRNEKQLQESLGFLAAIASSPVEWRFKRRALKFMSEHDLYAPDLICICSTAFQVVRYVSPETYVVTGKSADGEIFSIALILYEAPLCFKILKGWKGMKRSKISLHQTKQSA